MLKQQFLKGIMTYHAAIVIIVEAKNKTFAPPTHSNNNNTNRLKETH